jgi:hypothetical protein
MRKTIIALTLLLCAAVAIPAAAKPRPDVIPLPKGFGPEGIATAKKDTFFASSRLSGAIYRGSLRTGEGAILVPGGGQAATGIKVDKRNRLFVSGAGSKSIRIYDAGSGALLKPYAVDSGFINDVVLTKRAAYFTDSQRKQLYKVTIGKDGALGEEVVVIPLTGEFTQIQGQFNANGIEAAKGGKVLILVNSFTGELFTADPQTGVTRRIRVSGGDGELVNGDGILLRGRTLYVVENRDPNGDATGEVSVVKLRRNLSEGTIERQIVDPDFDVPTTIARSGGRLYAVNGRFNTPPTPETEYQVVKVPKR